MRFLRYSLLAATLFVLSCSSRQETDQVARINKPVSGPASAMTRTATTTSSNTNSSAGFNTSTDSITSTQEAPAIVAKEAQTKVQTEGENSQVVSLVTAHAAQTAAEAMDRKIIRNAELTVEFDAPAAGQRKIASIAEAHGGFVVTSETMQDDGEGESKPHVTVTVVVRVPATQFGAALEEIRRVGNRIETEKITGQDVTEEYIDLEARIRTQRALEAQFLEIMKEARRIPDALEVQRELADVRTEIEKLEGRRRFLENQSSLSTITATLQTPAPLVATSTSGFLESVKRAFGDGLSLTTTIILALIRLCIVLIPVGLLIFLPAGLLLRFVMRRFGHARPLPRLHQPPR